MVLFSEKSPLELLHLPLNPLLTTTTIFSVFSIYCVVSKIYKCENRISPTAPAELFIYICVIPNTKINKINKQNTKELNRNKIK